MAYVKDVQKKLINNLIEDMNNREIKFRVWDKEKKEMIYPSEELSSADILKQHGNAMQYTNLKDKNGVEIWEGDIVNAAWLHHGEPGEPFRAFIFYNEHIGSYRIGYASLGGGAQDKIYFRHQIEVIGNVYENRDWYKEIINNKAVI